MRGVLSLLVIGMLILSMSAVPGVTATTSTTTEFSSVVILVSDNEADVTLAEKIAEVINASIVITKWGVYEENVTAEIVSLDPDLVIIIGGPRAVVKAYEEDLEALGVTYIRAWGSTRVETAIDTINKISQMFPGFEKKARVAIVHGWDLAGIIHLRGKKFVIPIFIKDSSNVSITIINRFNGVEIVKNKQHEKIMEKVKERIRERVKNVTEETIENITQEIAERAINLAEERVSLAEELVNNMTQQNVTIPGVIPLLENAKRHLEEAKKAYEEGYYGRAYGLAVASKNIAEAVIRRVSEKVDEKFARDLAFKLRVRVRVLEKVALRLQAKGANVTEILDKIEQAKEALKNNDINTARQLIAEIEKELRMKGK
ncbi:cell wall-binding repeat-containing protein [Pyrococcus sp.]|uniref:cell wall-binding repeat-containing protein n=1 Tax=Pyrococcus sp. TaxID=33866 RepID=UPI00258AE1AC|nr:cell wall-binding repeat-containing protein [Pyrococcus sp.]